MLDWVSEHVPTWMPIFGVALMLPLLVIRPDDRVKITVGVVSG